MARRYHLKLTISDHTITRLEGDCLESGFSTAHHLLVAMVLYMLLVAFVLKELLRIILPKPLCFLYIKGACLRLYFLPLPAPWHRS